MGTLQQLGGLDPAQQGTVLDKLASHEMVSAISETKWFRLLDPIQDLEFSIISLLINRSHFSNILMKMVSRKDIWCFQLEFYC